MLKLCIGLYIMSHFIVADIYAQCAPIKASLSIKPVDSCGNFKFNTEILQGSDLWLQWIINGKTYQGIYDSIHQSFNDTTIRFTSSNSIVCKAVIGNSCGSVTLEKTVINSYIKPLVMRSENRIQNCSEVTFKLALSGSTENMNYHWTGDDMLDEKGISPAHTYMLPGKYNYRVEMDNACGDHLITDGSIAISNNVSCKAGPDFTTCIDAGKILLHAFPAGGQWFGRGIKADKFDPKTAGSGSHELVYVYRENGCVASDTLKVSVQQLEARGDFEQIQAEAPSEVRFVNYSSGNNFQSVWNFGDGTSSIIENPTHIYSEPGTYIAHIEVLDEKTGCASERMLNKTIVVQPPKANQQNNQGNTIIFNNRINIYSNPSIGTIQITVDKKQTMNYYNVQLVDFYGKILLEYNNLQQEKFDISIPQWPSGCFVIRVMSDDGTQYCQKLVTVR